MKYTQGILEMIFAGAALTVCAHDVLNPRFGFYAKLEWPEGTARGEGATPEDALLDLERIAQALRGTPSRPYLGRDQRVVKAVT